MNTENIIEKLKFNSHGLIPAIIQDWQNNEVLMMAYMNPESFKLTISTGITHFYSRSRQKLWKKGETSGHIQKVKEIYYDCDNDTLLIKVEQVVAACHTGARSCFFNKIEGKKIKFAGKKVFEPEKVYEKNIIEKLDAVILDRKTKAPEKSYVSSLLHEGSEKISKKVIEEALELILSSLSSEKNKDKVVKEASDLWFHTLVLLANKGIKGNEVLCELEKRFGKSGIQEKKERKR